MIVSESRSNLNDKTDILVLLNAPVWFHDPFSTHQLASWAVLAASTGLAIIKAGQPARGASQGTNLWFEFNADGDPTAVSAER
jgi:hypothetical protein